MRQVRSQRKQIVQYGCALKFEFMLRLASHLKPLLDSDPDRGQTQGEGSGNVSKWDCRQLLYHLNLPIENLQVAYVNEQPHRRRRVRVLYALVPIFLV